MKHISVLGGAFHYEFLMQLRRWSVWIAVLLVGLLEISIYSQSAYVKNALIWYFSMPLYRIVAELIWFMQLLLPIVLGVLLADRLPRDRRFKVEEIFVSMPGAISMRLVGKYLGSLAATLVPMMIFFVLGIGFIISRTQDWFTIPLALGAYVAVALPGLLFVAAFSLALPAVMWVPLYQFCFIGYWFWGNMLTPGHGVPTLTDTLLTPDGVYMLTGFYGLRTSLTSATPLQAIASIVALLAGAVVTMLVLWAFMRWRYVHS
jgi:hypothetical protein